MRFSARNPAAPTLALLALLPAALAAQTPGLPGLPEEEASEARLELIPREAVRQSAEELADSWYRTELIIFIRDEALADTREDWDPLPEPGYPPDYRFLLDPALADRRVEESLAFGSRIDEAGMQMLEVPAPVTEMLDHPRPDALLYDIPITWDPYQPADPNQAPATRPSARQAGTEGSDLPVDPNQLLDPERDDLLIDDSWRSLDDKAGVPDLVADLPPDPNDFLSDEQVRVLALPYELEDSEALEFSAQARSLRRRGHRVLFHGSWWAPLDDAETTLPLVLDRSGDPDFTEWPELQGSVHIYRSRYLHIAVDLWLNTDGGYLPEGWSSAAPPLARPSVSARTLAGKPSDPWAPQQLNADLPGIGPDAPDPTQPLSDPIDPLPLGLRAPGTLPVTNSAPLLQGAVGQRVDSPGATNDAGRAAAAALSPSAAAEMEPGVGAATGGEAEPEALEYPWRHAIRHRQSRRMRSGEIHYIDHPVIGVVVRVIPVSDEAMPLLPAASERAFRERHALPAEFIAADVEQPPAQP